jgi:hypothetical protein
MAWQLRRYYLLDENLPGRNRLALFRDEKFATLQTRNDRGAINWCVAGLGFPYD